MITVLQGCSTSVDKQSAKPLAKVGNHYLYFDEITKSVPDYILRSDSAAVVRAYVDQWVRNQVMYNEAIRLRLNTSDVIKNRIEKSTRDILVAELHTQIQLNSSSVSVSDEEVTQFYTNNRNMFILRERHLKVRHLFNSDRNVVENARAELLSGNSWDKIAAIYAKDKEYSLQTDRQLVAFSHLFSGYPTLQSYLSAVGLNEVSPLAQESGYYHFIQIVEDRPVGDHPELPYVFDKIKEWLSLDRSRRAIKAYEQNLYVQAEANREIVIYSDINN
jgi:hypothetical protein